MLGRVSGAVRSPWPGAVDHTRADLAGRDLRGHDLRGASLRSAVLIRADLRGCDLTDADALGAECRDADVRGTAMASALFLAQPQVNAMRGDAATTLPPGLDRPGHWR